MVTIQKPTAEDADGKRLKVLILVVIGIGFCAVTFVPDLLLSNSHQETSGALIRRQLVETACPYKSLDDLTPEERFPKQGSRHMVNPPQDTKVTLVCCETTAGTWNIAVHHSWAPLGAQRFLDIVNSKYFSNKVPLMRCVKDFLCQFGLAGAVSEQWKHKIKDDPQWLPKGPEYGVNDEGVKRFQKGYFSYAGSGKNTRGRQLFVALHDAKWLGGKSPWEVPWGELVGEHSYETLDKIYTGYGEHGPSQDLLVTENALEVVERDFPLIDYVLSCQVLDEQGEEPAGETAERRR